jgi:hypothetical protein
MDDSHSNQILMKPDLLRKLIEDNLYIAAIVAALPFWIVFHLTNPTLIDTTLPFPLQQFVLLVLIYPLLEEATFRGWLQGKFLESETGRKNWRGISFANLATSALFVIVHFFYHDGLWAAAVLLPSLVFGFFRERYQSIVPGLVLHIWYNCGYFWAYI